MLRNKSCTCIIFRKFLNTAPKFIFSLRKLRKRFPEIFYKAKKVLHPPKIKENLGEGGREITLKKTSKKMFSEVFLREKINLGGWEEKPSNIYDKKFGNPQNYCFGWLIGFNTHF
jgi:hypothetical protein